MSAQDDSAADDVLVHERRHLISLAFRMLGTLADAEDAVQEAAIRWYRMPEPDRERVEAPRAWLIRVVSRICLDMLGSARIRRERYVGPWLPEPIPAFALDEPNDPLGHVATQDSVSTALLLVLESMTPAERVAFVLHDVFGFPFVEVSVVVERTPAACRQLALSARARVERSPVRQVSREEHDRVVRAFGDANRTGDMSALVAALDPDVVLRSDGGGRVTAARRPIYGADRVSRFLRGVLNGSSGGMKVEEQETHDGLGFAVREAGRVIGVVTLEVLEGRIINIHLVRNPDKLSLWNP